MKPKRLTVKEVEALHRFGIKPDERPDKDERMHRARKALIEYGRSADFVVSQLVGPEEAIRLNHELARPDRKREKRRC